MRTEEDARGVEALPDGLEAAEPGERRPQARLVYVVDLSPTRARIER